MKCTIPKIENPENIKALFSLSVIELHDIVNLAINQAKKALIEVFSNYANQKSFINSITEIDLIISKIEFERTRLYILSLVHTNANLRQAAQSLMADLYNFNLDCFYQNKKLYKLVNSYHKEINIDDKCNSEEKFFVKKLQRVFADSGLGLSKNQQKLLKEKYSDLHAECLNFGQAINRSLSINFTGEELDGVSKNFLDSLIKNNDNSYVINLNYATYCFILEKCEVADTRKEMWIQFNKRAYPENEDRLKKIIKLRQEIAQILGYSSYANLDISDQMAQTPFNVEIFLNKLKNYFNDKANSEKKSLFENLPKGIVLSNNKIKPWDIEYILAKKNIKSANNVNEYFPFDHTLSQMLQLYSIFFGIRFKHNSCKDLWNEDLILIEVSDNESNLIGFIILDLFPRKDKYSHARHSNIVPATKFNDGSKSAALSIVITNISKELLSHVEVGTLFHEFGHAIHAILGVTKLGFLSGNRVVSDFLEMPSLMLEEWIWDPKILKQISRHYKSGNQLPDELIENVIDQRFSALAYWGERQIFLSLFSLYCYSKPDIASIKSLFDELHTSIITYVDTDESNHFYTSFTHIVTYGSKYYSYMWSHVYASDIFDFIKNNGFLNGDIGKDYVRKVLKYGGSVDPSILIRNFLNREPNEEPFFNLLNLK